MPLWLVEDPSTVYFVLGIAALAFAVLLWIRQERRWLNALVAVAALAALVALLDHFIVTDFERIRLDVKDMADSVAKKDTDRVFTHISDRFRLGTGGGDKKFFRGWVQDRIKGGEVTELVVWDFQRGDISTEKKEGKVLFLVKGRGPQLNDQYFRVVATFVLEGDGRGA